MEVSTALAPGDEAGTSDLLVTLEDGPVVQGLIDIDNHGNRFTGLIRRGLRVDVPNPRGYGDLLSLRVLDTGSGLVHGRLAYEGPIEAGPTRLGVSTALVDYQLGEEFTVLGAEGQARVNSLYLRYPIIRTADSNLTFGAHYDGKQMEDRILGAVTEKKANVATLRLSGERSTEAGRGGVSSLSVDVVSGNLAIESPLARTTDESTARTQGTYSRLNVNATHMQGLTASTSVLTFVSGQWALKNLDPSEKFALGGPQGVRAYSAGEGSGDEGWLATIELRHTLRQTDFIPGDLQLAGFVDGGGVRVSKNPWEAGVNHRTLWGGGIGLLWSIPESLSMRMDYAGEFGSEPSTSNDGRNGRLWARLALHF